MGRFAVAVGGFVLLLLLAPNPVSGRLAILGLAAFLIGVGLFMLFAARRREAANLTKPSTSRTETSSNNP
jgi:membrane-bound ClpP family serine protease